MQFVFESVDLSVSGMSYSMCLPPTCLTHRNALQGYPCCRLLRLDDALCLEEVSQCVHRSSVRQSRDVDATSASTDGQTESALRLVRTLLLTFLRRLQQGRSSPRPHTRVYGLLGAGEQLLAPVELLSREEQACTHIPDKAHSADSSKTFVLMCLQQSSSSEKIR